MLEIVGGLIIIAVIILAIRKMDSYACKTTEMHTKQIMELVRQSSAARLLVQQLNDLTEKQTNLRGQFDIPSSNALHSRYKNSLIMQFRDYERQKQVIIYKLKDMGINMGFKIVRDDGTFGTVSMDEYLIESRKVYDGPLDLDNKQDKAPEPPISVMPKGNLKVISNPTPDQGKKSDRKSFKVIQ